MRRKPVVAGKFKDVLTRPPAFERPPDVAEAPPEIEPAVPAVVEEEESWVTIGLEDVCEAPPPSPEPGPKPAQQEETARLTERPVQDEWGMFDPDQCGFAAVVAKLDEITHEDEADKPSAKSTARVIPY